MKSLTEYVRTASKMELSMSVRGVAYISVSVPIAKGLPRSTSARIVDAMLEASAAMEEWMEKVESESRQASGVDEIPF